MSKPDIDAPTQRILSVVEAISTRGPITLVGLCAILPISRAAIWRALDTLRVMGWIRMRAGDHAFEMRSDMLARLHSGHCSNPAVEAIAPIFDQLANFGPVHVDLGGFADTGVFHILESTRKQFYDAPSAALSLVDEDVAIAAQLTVPPPNLVLHLRAFMVKAQDEERRAITSGEHGRFIARMREEGYFWAPDHSSVAISMAEFPGFALRVELWRVSRATIRTFTQRIEEFMAQRKAQHPYSNPLMQGYGMGQNTVQP